MKAKMAKRTNEMILAGADQERILELSFLAITKPKNAPAIAGNPSATDIGALPTNPDAAPPNISNQKKTSAMLMPTKTMFTVRINSTALPTGI